MDYQMTIENTDVVMEKDTLGLGGQLSEKILP